MAVDFTAVPSSRIVAGYTRISRVGGRRGEGFISKDDQTEGIDRRAGDLGLTVGEWFHDEDHTGGNMQRPQWEKLMGRVTDPTDPLSGVIVVRVDRFARTVPEGAPEVQRIWQANGIFVAADLPVDTTTPFGRKTLWDWLSNAEMFLEMNKAQWWRTKERAIKRGAHIGRTPLGMYRIPKNAPADAGELRPQPEWVPVVTGIFRYAAQNPLATESAIAAWAREGLPRPDGKRWTHGAVAHLLTNRVYLGEVHYRPRKADFTAMANLDAHAAIVDDRTFQAAQRTHKVQTREHIEGDVLLQGIVRCAHCRQIMVPSYAAKGDHRTYTYRCNGKSVAGQCPSPAAVARHLLDQWAITELRRRAPEIKEVYRALAKADSSLVDAAELDLREAREERTAIAENSEMAARYPNEWMTALGSADAKIAECEHRLAEAAGSVPELPVLGAEITWETLSVPELRRIMLRTVGAVVVSSSSGRKAQVGDRARLLFLDEVESDLPRKGRPATDVRGFDLD